MNNEFSPIELPAARKKHRENIIMVLLGIKTSASRKCVEQVKSQWIPCDCEHHFSAFNYIPWPFGWLFVWAEPDMLMICRKVKPQLIKGDNELPSVMFDRTELTQ
jgi:hypothetical protein